MADIEGRSPKEVKAALVPLVAWFKQNKPACKRVACSQSDYDRLRREQSKNLESLGFTMTGPKDSPTIYFDGFELYRK